MNEYLLGNLCGLSQTIIGYPFDTLKTNLQNSKSIKPFLQSPTLLYRGVKYPLATSMIGTTFMFGNYSYFQELTQSKLAASVITGITGAFLITPFDYLKIQRQIQEHSNEKTQKNIIDLINNPKQVFRGMTLTILRETFAIPAYFLTFDYMYYQNSIHPFLSGGIAGINSWLFTYPLDTLKSRRQLYHNKSLQELIKIGSLYNGLGITLLRGFIVNGASFYFYTIVKKYYNML
jgi:solute carrier family 25 carnitine/acylcarnitine transporter 20/29